MTSPSRGVRGTFGERWDFQWCIAREFEASPGAWLANQTNKQTNWTLVPAASETIAP